MPSADETEVVVFEKSAYDVRSEGVGNSSLVFGPAFVKVGWVRPEEIAGYSFILAVQWSGDAIDLIERLEGGAESSVNAEYLLFHEGCVG